MTRWWISEPHLLASSNPTSGEIEALAADGFSVLISLLDEAEQAPAYDLALVASLGMERHNIPVRDFQAPTTDELTRFLRLVDGAGAKRIVVHCLGGSGRTGTFAAAYWIGRGLSAREAVLKVRGAKPTAIETREQLMVLSAFEQAIRGDMLQPGDEGGVDEALPTGAEVRAQRHAGSARGEERS